MKKNKLLNEIREQITPEIRNKVINSVALEVKLKEAKEYFIGNDMIGQMTSDKATYTNMLLKDVYKSVRTKGEEDAIEFWDKTGFIEELNRDEKYCVQALLENAKKKPVPKKTTPKPNTLE